MVSAFAKAYSRNQLDNVYGRATHSIWRRLHYQHLRVFGFGETQGRWKIILQSLKIRWPKFQTSPISIIDVFSLVGSRKSCEQIQDAVIKDYSTAVQVARKLLGGAPADHSAGVALVHCQLCTVILAPRWVSIATFIRNRGSVAIDIQRLIDSE